MKKLVLIFFLITTKLNATPLVSYDSNQPPGPFGLGIVVGSPIAVTGKYWFNKINAADFGLSWGSDYTFLIYGDYLWHYPQIFGHSTHFLSHTEGYVGVGGGIFNWANTVCTGNRPQGWTCRDGSVGLYARVPFGAEWFAGSPRLGVFAELVPGLAIIPGVGLTFDFGVGARYYF